MLSHSVLQNLVHNANVRNKLTLQENYSVSQSGAIVQGYMIILNIQNDMHYVCVNVRLQKYWEVLNKIIYYP